MKTKKIIWFLILLNVFLLPSKHLKSCPECDTSKFILAIYPENSKYLQYAHYQNVFDTCNVSMTVGEFRIKSANGEITRIYPIFDTTLLSLEHPHTYIGSNGSHLLGLSTPGIDTILSAVFRTQTFKYVSNSKLLFFRELRAGIKCLPNYSEPSDTLANHCPDIPRIFWLEKYCIPDTSEWVIQVVDATTHQVLFVIDSVGFLPNGNCPFAVAYGTDPYKMNHERILPNEFSYKDVYIKISVRRYGPTPFGMLFNPVISRLNASAVQEYVNECNNSGYSCNFDHKKFDYYYYKKVIEYLDSLTSALGRVPNSHELPLLYFSDIDSNYITKIYNRYFTYDSSLNGWVIPPSDTTPKFIPYDDYNLLLQPNIIIQKVDTKENNGIITLSISLKNKESSIVNKTLILTNVQIEIFNIRGEKIQSKYFENVTLNPTSTTTVAIDLKGNFPKGVYFLVLSSPELPRPVKKVWLKN